MLFTRIQSDVLYCVCLLLVALSWLSSKDEIYLSCVLFGSFMDTIHTIFTYFGDHWLFHLLMTATDVDVSSLSGDLEKAMLETPGCFWPGTPAPDRERRGRRDAPAEDRRQRRGWLKGIWNTSRIYIEGYLLCFVIQPPQVITIPERALASVLLW